MSAATHLAPAPAASPSTPKKSALAAYVPLSAALLGSFTTGLGVQMVNSAIGDLGGTIHASADEASWITTSYAMAEILAIPLSAMAMQVLGLRRYMTILCVGFILSALLSTVATTLATEIALRAIQGFFSGAFGVAAFGLTFQVFAKSGKAFGLALLTFCQTFPSNLGAVLAGYLTELQVGWPLVYYIEIGLALVILVEILASTERQCFNWMPLKATDWLGYALLAPGLSLTIMVLSQGNRRFWFDSDLIVNGTIAASALLALFLVMDVGRKGIIDFSLLGRRAFGAAVLLNLFFRFGLLESNYVLPQFLGQIQGYRPREVADVIAVTCAVQAMAFVASYQLVVRISPRLPVFVGLVMFATGGLVDAFSTAQTASDQFLWTQVLLGAAPAFFIVPLLVIGTAPVGPKDGPSASTFFNGSRSIGQQMGTAFLATLIRYRENYHSARLTENTTQGALQDSGRLDGLAASFGRLDPDAARQMAKATATLARQAQTQAYTLAYNDAFLAMAVVLSLGAVLTLLLPPAKTPER